MRGWTGLSLMAEVVELKRRAPESMLSAAGYLRNLADRCEEGSVTELLVVSNVNEDGMAFEKYGAWEDRWRMLGALEYAKSAVHSD